jgi:hypothetical protein
MGKERRKRTRVKFSIEVKVTVDNLDVRVQSYNFSLKGMLCSSNRLFHENQPCRVTLNLTQETKEEPIRAVIHGRVVRTGPEETAIDFSVMDTESFLHLKKIVELNAGEPERISRELLTSAFFPRVDR